MNATRPLIAFAFVKEEFDRTGDIVRGLMPLFEPIFGSMAGSPFDPRKFSEQVKSYYGLHINVLVVEDWVTRFEQSGFLESTGDKYSRSYICKAQSNSLDVEAVNQTQETLRALVDHVSERLVDHNFNVMRDSVEQSVIERLRRPDFLNLLLKPELSRKVGSTLSLPGSVADTGPDLEAAMDYVLAARLTWMADERPGQFKSVTNVAAGALVSEVVFNLRQPPVVGQKSGGTIAFIDSPLLLDLLDLADAKQHIYVTELLSDLKKTGFKPYTFDHNVSEVRSILKGTLDHYREVEVATGTVAYRLRTDQTARSRAQSIRPNLEARVRALGINIVDMDTFTASNADRFNEDAITDLIARIRPMGDIFSREIDARSVAGVARLVLGRKSTGSILNLPAVFITKNSGVVREAIKTLSEEGNYHADAAPPFLTIRQVAGLVWLAIGGDAGGVSASQLLANCSLVATPRRDVLSTVYKVLRETDERAAQEFEALMSEDRCAHYVMDYTLGDAALVTADNAFDILSEIKAKAVEDIRREDRAKFEEELGVVRAEASGKIEQQRAEFEALRRVYEERKKQDEDRARALELELDRARLEQGEQARKISETQNSIIEMEMASLVSCMNFAKRRTTIARIVLACIASFLIAVGGYLTNLMFTFVKDHNVLVVIGGVYALVSFLVAAAFGWIAPDIVFGKYFEKIQKKVFLGELRRRGQSGYLTRWEHVPARSADPQFRPR